MTVILWLGGGWCPGAIRKIASPGLLLHQWGAAPLSSAFRPSTRLLPGRCAARGAGGAPDPGLGGGCKSRGRDSGGWVRGLMVRTAGERQAGATTTMVAFGG